ncbi:MAG: hypothetical protein HRT44_12970, partial [Bdellovibrionales bacterium]|nr:hypothetical protein [Bdellovibrionales bacterium]
MFTFKDIKKVHIEISSCCNAACGNCPRNIHGSNHKRTIFDETEISFESFKNYFSIELIEGLTDFTFCGNYGDPSLATDLVSIVNYIKEHNPRLYLQINTNGGARNREFWTDLAK